MNKQHKYGNKGELERGAERLNDWTPIGDAKVRTTNESSGEKSEVVSPPRTFECAKCEMSFDPSDWQNDICDFCLYKRARS